MYHSNTGRSPFDEVLAEIAGTRSAYETLRETEGSFDERARLVSRLHTLRARAAALRTTL